MKSSATNTVPGTDSDNIKKYLFKIGMKSQWKEVVQVYRNDEWAHKAKITRSGDTALHIAVSDCQEKWVAELVNLVAIEDLRIQNERGNTPLHLSAAMGNVGMCKYIAQKDPSLVGIPNKDKETPLFLASVQGKKDAFLCLHYICTPDESQQRFYRYCRRENGETVLHCAIAGEYFGNIYKHLI
ncbi:hypothetical protein M0R45_010765 [Rubus argutus]|uniref:Uncharacterized protein n=1 Tax=Rubus argutus TaxID=59490 RepID=A0AAW1YB40_RUBAR